MNAMDRFGKIMSNSIVMCGLIGSAMKFAKKCPKGEHFCRISDYPNDRVIIEILHKKDGPVEWTPVRKIECVLTDDIEANGKSVEQAYRVVSAWEWDHD